MKDRVTPNELAASIAAYQAALRYEEPIQKTEKGRLSIQIRDRGTYFAARGYSDRAWELYCEAARMFGPEDRGAAACSARFDLGSGYLDRESGVRLENLREAERLLREVEGSLAWRQDPMRLALSRDALGRALRQLAIHAHPEHRREMEVEALKFMVSACERTSESGPIGWTRSVCYHINLANLLLQMEELDDAVQANEEALRLARRVDLHRENPMIKEQLGKRRNDFVSDALVNLATGLVTRGRPEDLQRALTCCDECERRGHALAAPRGRLVAAQAHHRLGDYNAALQDLRRVEFNALPEPFHDQALRLSLDIGAFEWCLAIAEDGVRRAWEKRTEACADHAAQHADQAAQRFGRFATEVHHRNGHPIEAFLALENVSGLTYYDYFTRNCLPQASDAVDANLGTVTSLHAWLARNLEDMEGRVTRLPTDGQRDFIRAFARTITSASDWREVDPTAKAALTEVLTETTQGLVDIAQTSSSCLSALHEAVEYHKTQHERLLRVRAIQWPGMVRKPKWTREMIPSDLVEILNENPGLVLVRVHLSHELLAASVWLEGGSLTGRTMQHPLPQGWAGGLRAAMDGGLPSPSAFPPETAVALDLSAVLPDHVDQLVILPSYLGMMVPWAATGAPLLVWKVDAITILPSLVPLWVRPTTPVARTGQVAIIPGRKGRTGGTQYHELAFSSPAQGETCIDDVNATVGACLAATRTANVLSFYAHGHGEPGEEGGVCLSDGILGFPETTEIHRGMERVELWSCKSGINVPTDWMTPPVDDGFGLDIAYHHAGVRTTIGTLWSVPDLVTACLVRRFREAITAQEAPPQALVTAQRWWLGQAAPALVRFMDALPEEEAIRSFVAQVGARSDPGDPGVSSLGPLPSNGSPSAVFTSPLSWAAYRFVGAAGKEPTLDPIPRATMTEEERSLFRQLLNHQPPAEYDLLEIWEEWLNTEGKLEATAHPTPEQAIRMARLYQDRRLSNPTHNLVRGLAWLHEVLTLPGIDSETITTLRTEAAWLWLELARGEMGNERLLDFTQQDPGPVIRLRRLAAEIPGLEGDLLSGWSNVLDRHGKMETKKRARKVLSRLRLDSQSLPSEDHAMWRLLCGIGEMMLLAQTADPDMLAFIERPLRAVAEVPVPSSIVWNRLMLVLSALHRDASLSHGPELVSMMPSIADLQVHTDEKPSRTDRTSLQRPEGSPLPPMYAFRVDHLRHRDLGRAVALLYDRLDQPGQAFEPKKECDRSLSLLDEWYWGQPSDDRQRFWATTGSPGASWFDTGGMYISSSIRFADAQARAVHYIAWLQMTADLRVQPLGSLARLLHLPPKSALDPQMVLYALWHSARSRDSLIRSLVSCARAPWALGPIPLGPDPFRSDADSIVSDLPDGSAAPELWSLATGIEEVHRPVAPSKTLAFAVEQNLRALDDVVESMWEAVIGPHKGMDPSTEARRNILTALDPGIEIAQIEHLLRNQDENTVILSLFLGTAREPVACAIWNDGSRIHQVAEVGQPLSGFLFTRQAVQVLGPGDTDYTPEVGVSPGRDSAWSELRGTLDGILAQVLEEMTGTQHRLLVFNPGPFRSVPFIGLTIRGKPLWSCFDSICHLPDLRSVERRPAKGTAAYCAVGHETDEGEIRFGRAAVDTLRRWFPPRWIGDAKDNAVDEVVEIKRLAEIGPNVESVRLYAMGHPMEMGPGSAGILWGEDRMMGTAHLLRVHLPLGPTVELWSATSTMTEMLDIIRLDGDHLPPLVRSFLTSGATSAMDVAWPVHDLVQALVAERVGVLRSHDGFDGARALVHAVRWVDQTLTKMRSIATFTAATEILAWLDGARHEAAKAAGLDPSAIVPFAPLSHIPSVAMDAAALVEILSRSSNLSAYRWWGR